MPRAPKLPDQSEFDNEVDDDNMETVGESELLMERTGSGRKASLITIGKVPVISIGEMEIWDGADSSLLRETLEQLRSRFKKIIGVDMRYVKSLPPGIFNILQKEADEGREVILITSQDAEYQTYLWFTQSCIRYKGIANAYRILSEKKAKAAPTDPKSTTIKTSSKKRPR